MGARPKSARREAGKGKSQDKELWGPLPLAQNARQLPHQAGDLARHSQERFPSEGGRWSRDRGARGAAPPWARPGQRPLTQSPGAMSGKGVSKAQADVLAKFRQSQAKNTAVVADIKRAQEERSAKAKADPSKAAAGVRGPMGRFGVGLGGAVWLGAQSGAAERRCCSAHLPAPACLPPPQRAARRPRRGPSPPPPPPPPTAAGSACTRRWPRPKPSRRCPWACATRCEALWVGRCGWGAGAAP